jgi:hypothetical protein
MGKIDECPPELGFAIRAFWPEEEWENAASVSELESGWNAFALLDTATRAGGCGKPAGEIRGVPVTGERSVGYFQINTCNYPSWNPWHFYNAWHNAGTAHMLWEQRGWQPWFFSAQTLGLLSG